MGLRRKQNVEQIIPAQPQTTISVSAGEGAITEITVQASTPAVAFKLFQDVRKEVCAEHLKKKNNEQM